MRAKTSTSAGLLRPQGAWVATLALLLLTVTGSGGQDQRVQAPAKFKVTLKGNNPDASQRITYDEATLDITNAALDGEFDLDAQALESRQLPPLDSGMSNVTRGPRAGYRLLPHGKTFKKEIRLTLPFDKAKLPPGSGPEDVKTFYYDEVDRRWKALARATVDFGASTVTSLTDHFTDFINATITVPDHPGVASHNPTDLKDLAAADPGAGITLIDVPKPNPMGSANVSYSLELPPGRAGMRPNLAVSYSSSSGNGWLGLGWGLGAPSVGIDTRWGVPRYRPDVETETYLLAGEQLTPLAHRGEPKPREAEKTFRRRVEGRFDRIVRHGDHPSRYWWQVTDKNGVKSFYGGDPTLNAPSPECTLATAGGDLYHWALRETRDPNGNFVRYRYAKVSDSGIIGGAVPGTELYLQSITYTGHGAQEGPYKVEFFRDRDLGEARRPDVTIDARCGAKRVTADLLRRVDVSLNGGLIRRYELRYREGAFRKTLLEAVIQYGEDGTSEFYRHRFEYHDEIRNAEGAYLGFAPQSAWSMPGDGISIGLLGQGKASALSGSETNSRGGHVYVGVGGNPTKSGSAGFKVGHQRSDSKGMLALIDLNGDGLPDKVFKSGGGLRWRSNLGFNPAENRGFFGEASLPVIGIGEISRERSITWSAGAEAHPGISVYANTAQTTTDGTVYFTDANGDGYPDLVNGGRVFFGRLVNGIPTYSENSADTPVPVGGGVIDHNRIIEDLDALYQEQIDTFPLADTLRRWVAPWDGVVQITGAVRLLEDPSPERQESTTADGVRVAIQKNGNELWAQVIAKDDYAPKPPLGVESIAVSRGDRIYFRVGSVEQGLFDQVEWDPLIAYMTAPVLDQNGRDVYRYKASEDWTFGGRRNVAFPAPIPGTIRLEGSFEKLGPTSDDVRVQILRNGVEVFGRDFARGATETAAISQDFSVTTMDSVELRIKIDSPIDLGKTRFAPRLYYVTAPPDVTLQDPEGNFILDLPGAYAVDIYPANTLLTPQETWTASGAGTFMVQSGIATHPSDNSTNGELVLTAKANGVLLGKGIVTIQNGNVTQASFPITLDGSEKVFFDLSARDSQLDNHLAGRLVKIQSFPDDIVVPHAYHEAGVGGLFPEAFRGWSVAGYNANRERAAAPIDETRLVFTPADYGGPEPHKMVKAYPFFPQPRQNRWQGPDELGWASASQLSASRLGLDEIQVPRPGNFLNLRAPVRLSRSRQFSVGGGFDIPGVGAGLSGSVATGRIESLVDYLDLNGDRFPDILGNGHVQYTLPTGEVNADGVGWGLGKVRETSTQAWNFGVGGSPPLKTGDSTGRADNANGRDLGAQSGVLGTSFGASGDFGASRSDAQEELQDVNGDGLPDRVKRTDDGLEVKLNLGYSFAGTELWGSARPHDGESKSASIGGSLGFNFDKLSYGGGLSLSKNECKTRETLIDLNGDGLPDRVKPGAGGLEVSFNQGNGFAAAVPYAGAEVVARGGDITLGGGAYFTIPIPIPFTSIYILINPGVSVAQAVGRQERVLKDIDGDGYEDQIESESDGELRVSRNRTGKTNLLKKVLRPLGATITLDYERKGNTVDDPQGRWVLARAEVFDGHVGDGIDIQLFTVAYEGGHWDRLEREFLGYARMRLEQRDPSQAGALYRTVVNEYRNDGVYTKGLLTRVSTQDAAGRVYLEAENTYVLRDVDSGLSPADPRSLSASLFPTHVRVDRRFFEGGPAALKTTFTLHEYDALGNMTRMIDSGDAGAEDDIDARVVYSNVPGPYIVGKPTSLQIVGDGVLLRRREGVIDPATGNLTRVRQFLADGSVAETDLEYFPNGTLRSVVGPPNHRGQRYVVSYQYDTTVATHVVRASDSFGNISTSDHDFKLARPTLTRDMNGNEQSRTYDNFGRLLTVTGPYELAAATATIRFEYHPHAPVPWALTRHLDSFRDPGDPIESVLFTDGLNRPIQTKKDGVVHAGPGAPAREVMLVSGRSFFDFVGRVIEQRYPLEEPLGARGVFNAAVDDVPPTRFEFDVLDRRTRVTLPDGTFTTSSFGFGQDRAGVLRFATTATDANGQSSVSYQDVRGLTTSLKEFNVQKGQVIWTSYAYDSLRQLTAVVDDGGNSTRSEYDLLGRRTALESPDKGRTEQRYDLAGNVVSRVTAVLRGQGRAIAYEYEFGRLIRVLYPNTPANNVTYEYGPPGAPFNRAGRIFKISDAGGTVERFYGKLGEVVKETRFVPIDVPGGDNARRTFTTEYAYDSFNRLQRLIYPDGEVLRYLYDAGGRMRAAEGAKGGETRAYVSRLEYDKFGAPEFRELGNGIATRYAYDERTRRLSVLASARAAEAPFQNLDYAYDNVGNVLRIRNQVDVPVNGLGGPTVQSYQYDSLYRLTRAEGAFSGDLHGLRTSEYLMELDFDSLHNVRKKSQSVRVNGKVENALSFDWVYHYQGPRPHAPTRVGRRDFEYDADGNQIAFDGPDDRGEPGGGNGRTKRTMSWDEEDRLTSVTDQKNGEGGGGDHPNSGATTSFVYDHSGQRVIKRSSGHETAYVNAYFTVRNRAHQMLLTKHVFIGPGLIASTSIGGTLTDPHKEVASFFYHGDHLGSSQYLSDRQGRLRKHVEVLPFGEAWVSGKLDNADQVGQEAHLFTGKPIDPETGLHYFGARYYDARTSVWQNPDPMLGHLGSIAFRRLALTPYAYANQRPTVLTDPTGLTPQDPTEEEKLRFEDLLKSQDEGLPRSLGDDSRLPEFPSTSEMLRKGELQLPRSRSATEKLLLNIGGSVLSRFSKLDLDADSDDVLSALKGGATDVLSEEGKIIGGDILGYDLGGKPKEFYRMFDSPGSAIDVPLSDPSAKTKFKFTYDIPSVGGTGMNLYRHLTAEEDLEVLKFGVGFKLSIGKNFNLTGGGSFGIDVDPEGEVLRIWDYIDEDWSFNLGVELRF